jgi:hypothetical protein
MCGYIFRCSFLCVDRSRKVIGYKSNVRSILVSRADKEAQREAVPGGRERENYKSNVRSVQCSDEREGRLTYQALHEAKCLMAQSRIP